MKNPADERLPITLRTIADAGGEPHCEMRVCCPNQASPVRLEHCIACESFERLDLDTDAPAEGRLYCHSGRGDEHRRRADAAARLMPTMADDIPVSDLMSTDVVCVRPDLPLDEVLATLVRYQIQCAPVVDAYDRPIGLVTRTDLERGRIDSAAPVAVEARTVNGVPEYSVQKIPPEIVAHMSFHVGLTVRAETSLRRAAEAMVDAGLTRVPVVAKDGSVVGILSSTDVLRFLAGVERDPEGRATTPPPD